MKHLLLAAGLLGLASCGSEALSGADKRHLTQIAHSPQAQHSGTIDALGSEFIDSLGLVPHSSLTRRSIDTIALGMLVLSHSCTSESANGKLLKLKYEASGVKKGNKVQGLVEQLCGPLQRVGFSNTFYAHTGTVAVEVRRELDGSCQVIFTPRDSIQL